jgi:hypothetical protein
VLSSLRLLLSSSRPRLQTAQADSTSAGNHPRFSRPQGVRAATSRTEKRKVGGSTPPLTTSPEQPKRLERSSPGAFLFGFDDNADDNVPRVDR